MLRDRFGDLFKDKVGVAVAHHLIPQQVQNQVIVHGDFRKDNAGPALIDLQHDIIGTHRTAQRAGRKQCCSHTGGEIGAFGIIGNGKAVFAQHVCDQIGGGCFSVGAGDANDLAGKAQFFQYIRVKPQRNAAGQVGAAAQ